MDPFHFSFHFQAMFSTVNTLCAQVCRCPTQSVSRCITSVFMSADDGQRGSIPNVFRFVADILIVFEFVLDTRSEFWFDTRSVFWFTDGSPSVSRFVGVMSNLFIL